MLSDVTIGVQGHTLTMSGADLLVLGVLVFAIAMLATAFRRGRHVELRHSDATDILIVQLERIGDTLDRIVAQNARLAPAAGQREVQALRAEVLPEGEVAKPVLQAESRPPVPPPNPSDNVEPDGSVLSDSVRSVVYSMLRP